jgi:hypothetical protein
MYRWMIESQITLIPRLEQSNLQAIYPTLSFANRDDQAAAMIVGRKIALRSEKCPLFIHTVWFTVSIRLTMDDERMILIWFFVFCLSRMDKIHTRHIDWSEAGLIAIVISSMKRVRTVPHRLTYEVSLTTESPPSQVLIEQSWLISPNENQSLSGAYAMINGFICMLKADNRDTVNHLSESVQ